MTTSTNSNGNPLLTKLKALPKKPPSKAQKDNPILKAIHEGPVNGPNGVKVRVKRVLNAGLREAVPTANGVDTLAQSRGEPKKTFLSLVRQVLKQKIEYEDGRVMERQQRAAEVFVEQMEEGEFPFFKELIEREEGKVTQPVQHEIAQKAYIGLPVDDKAGAP